MLKETPLIEEHRRLGAKFMSFHGWKLPLEFSGATAEHLNVRNKVGLFDVSHLGEIRVRGKNVLPFLEKCLTNNVSALKENQIQYNLLCNEQGGIIDDLILYCLKPDEDYLLCVNASRLKTDFNWLYQTGQKLANSEPHLPLEKSSQKTQNLSSPPTFAIAGSKGLNKISINQHKAHNDNISLQDESNQWAQLALQGPKALSLMTKVLGFSSSLDIKKNHSQWFSFSGEGILVSATGYTGEKGVEILISTKKVNELWRAILEKGKTQGCLPVGLAARDTLRMEMKYPLYGKDLNENIDPHSAGLSWAVKNQNNFIGSRVLSKMKKNIKKKWVGFKILQPSGVPRQGYRIFIDGSLKGEVTSGAKSPVLNQMIGLGYVPIEYAFPNQRIQVEIHQNLIPAEIVATPFIKKYINLV
ncbi:MAG: hypothetical protein OXM55_01170 [Bdellovibrionales bacterium]|nr:hypothetical protein [Bdellovibrionales bacterium]